MRRTTSVKSARALLWCCFSFPSWMAIAWQQQHHWPTPPSKETTIASRRQWGADLCQKLVAATAATTATVVGTGNAPVANAATTEDAAIISKSSLLLASKNSLASRFEQDSLQQPTPTIVDEGMQGIDNFFYPDFMEGTWNVTQTLVQASTPLGLIYLGGPNGDLSIAQKTQRETVNRIGVPVELQFRYVRTKWGVAEDRLLNTRNRLNAFAGRNVVASTAYADVGSCNRKSLLAQGGSDDDPLQTTLVRFKGPAAQKTFLTSHRSDPLRSTATTWTGSEGFRSIFALTNENTAPPIFTDTESIWQFTQLDTDSDTTNRVQGRLRIASYLNAQQDKLYFETRNRAVSLLDYTLDLRRVA